MQSQIYDAFGYLTIPATFLTAFLLFGFLEIGQEMYVSMTSWGSRIMMHYSENPFNYDLNDLGRHIGLLLGKPNATLSVLDLDHFCHIIHRELHEITAVLFLLLLTIKKSD